MAIEKFPDEISSIRALLSENPEGLTIKSISEMLGMNRNAAANNLHLLQMQGRVTLKRVGAAKIYCQANKLPVDAVLKLSNNGVLVFGRGEAVVDMNEPFRQLLHLAKRDLIGKTTGQLPFFVESIPELTRLIRDGLKGKENRVSAEMVLADRSLPCTLTILPVFFENGEPGVALIADIPAVASYPHRNEYGADDSLAELDMTEYICRFTPDGTLTYVNRAYGDLLQKGKTELTGHRWRPTVPKSEYTRIKQCLLSLDSAHPVSSLDFRAITPRGDSRLQRWIFRILFDQAGKSIGYQGTGSDITDMKNLEETVQKGVEERESLVRGRLVEVQDLNRQIYNEIASHEKTHTKLQFTQFAVDNASYLIMWASRGGRFVYMNREAQKVLGYQHRDLGTEKFQDIIAGVFPFSWDETWEVILRDRHYMFETAIIGHDGRVIPIEMVLNYLKFKDKQYCCCFAKDITERSRAEEALRESEQKYRDIFERSVSGLFKTTPGGMLVDANDAFAHMYGYIEAAEMLHARMDVNLHLYAYPEDRNEVVRILAEQDKIENYETLHKKRDGTRFWVSITARTIRDTEGTVLFYEGSNTDITDRRRAEESLDLQSRIVQNMAEGVVMIQASDGVIVYANPRFECMFGYGAGELTKRHIRIINAPGEKDPQVVADEIITSLLQTGEWNGEIHNIRKDGTMFWCNATTTTFNHPEYGLVWVSVHLDITKRKMAEAALEASEHKYRTLVENIPEKIFTKDTNEAYVSCNKHYARDLGIAVEAIVGKTDYDFYPRDLADKYRAYDREVMASGATHTIEERYIVNGKESWVSTLKTPILDEAGNVSGILGIFHDITSRKRKEEALREKSSYALKTTSDSLQKTEAELHLHQNELEMQNEELRKVQVNLERSRERYFELYDLAPAGYLTLNKQGLIINANFTTATLLGVDRKSLVNTSFSRFIVPDHQDVFYGCRNELIKTGNRQSCELYLMYPDGPPFRVQVIAVPAPASEGAEAALSLMLIDITGRKQIDEAQQKREKIFGVMFESHDSVMLLIDPGSGIIRDANLAAERFYGRSRETLCTLSIDEINTLPPKEVKALRAKVVRGQITTFTSQHRHSSGEARTVEVHSSPVAIGGKTLLFSIIHDITETEAGGRGAADSRAKEYGSG